jgi:hypothetical protein
LRNKTEEKIMTRNIIAIAAAIVTGGLVVYSMDMLGHQIYPVTSGLDPARPETIIEYLKTAPVGALLWVALAQAAGAFSGGSIAMAISKTKRAALVYGIIALVFGAVNILTVPHPPWLEGLLVILPIPSAMLGALSVSQFRRRESARSGPAREIST